MIPIKRHGQFLLDKESDRDDAKLRYRIKWNGNTVAFNVGYRVIIDKWSTETQRCKNGTSHGKNKTSASEINRVIQNMEDRIAAIFHQFELDEKIPSADDLRSKFNILSGKKVSPDKTNTISFIFDKFIQQSSRENSWTDATTEKLGKLKDRLTDCFGDISITDLNESSMMLFLLHLQKQGMRNTTITKNVNNLKWFLRWAKRHKYIQSDFYTGYNPKLKGANGRLKTIIYLNWDELLNLYNLEITNKALANVRDVFCFCCFTGLRYSDVARLRKDNVSDNCISIVTEKTDDPIKIELNNYSRSIIDKYSGEKFPGNTVLPVISNQKMNVHLKDLGKLAELNEPVMTVFFKGNQRYEEVHPKHELLTTHCGRRTFVTNALYLGIPAEVIMKWTGHSDFDSMKPYIEIVDQLKADEMAKFNRE